MRDIEKAEEKKQDAKLRISRYLSKADVVLTSAEETILSRWEFADLMMRQGITLTEALIQKITEKFGVSRFTADSDIANSMEVFAKSRKVNRKYLGHLHLQDISADLIRVRDSMFKNKAIPSAKDLQALAKLHDAYTYQLNSLPEEAERIPVGKITMQFELPNKQAMAAPLPFNAALMMADKILDIPHEEVNLENRKTQSLGADPTGNKSAENLAGEA